MKQQFVIIFLTIFVIFRAEAQQLHQYLDNNTRYKTSKYITKNKMLVHTSFKPIQKKYIKNIDSVIYEYGRDSLILSKLKHPVWWKKLRTEDLLLVNEDGFYLAINPVFDFSSGKDYLDSSLSINTRGVSIKGNLGKKVSFKSDFYENQAFFPEYIRDYSKKHKVVPGQGRLRGFKSWGFDYSNASGYLSYSPFYWLNISLGHGKHFIGEGYRSLLISDNSFNYPYFKITAQTKKLQYVYMLTSFQSAETADSRTLVYQRKHGSFLFLNYIFNSYLQLGLFEGVIFKTMGEGYNNKFPASFFSPIIFSRAIQYGLDNENNVLLGITAKSIISKGIQAYGQFALDDDVLNKYAYQLGAKFFDFLWLKNFYMQLEYNFVKPYMYSHYNKLQNYSFYNQAFAATPETGFKELVGILRYRIKDFIFSFKVNQILTSYEEQNDNLGVNIFKSDSTASIDIKTSYPGVNNTLYKTYLQYKISYLINPATNFQIYFAYTNRKLSNTSINENFYFFGIKTSLRNYYYDF